MNGKKVAIYFVGFIIAVCIIIVVVMQIFFSTYEPENNETSFENQFKLVMKSNI